LEKILIFKRDFNGAFYEIRNMGSNYFKSFRFQNAQVTKRLGFKTLRLQNAQITKRSGYKTLSFQNRSGYKTLRLQRSDYKTLRLQNAKLSKTLTLQNAQLSKTLSFQNAPVSKRSQVSKRSGFKTWFSEFRLLALI
jgi:hypothetical protein